MRAMTVLICPCLSGLMTEAGKRNKGRLRDDERDDIHHYLLKPIDLDRVRELLAWKVLTAATRFPEPEMAKS